MELGRAKWHTFSLNSVSDFGRPFAINHSEFMMMSYDPGSHTNSLHRFNVSRGELASCSQWEPGSIPGYMPGHFFEAACDRKNKKLYIVDEIESGLNKTLSVVDIEMGTTRTLKKMPFTVDKLLFIRGDLHIFACNNSAPELPLHLVLNDEVGFDCVLYSESRNSRSNRLMLSRL